MKKYVSVHRVKYGPKLHHASVKEMVVLIKAGTKHGPEHVKKIVHGAHGVNGAAVRIVLDG